METAQEIVFTFIQPFCGTIKSMMVRMAGILGVLTLAQCSVGPGDRPLNDAHAPSFKECAAATPPLQGWKKAQPRDEIPKGAWWTLYKDPTLNALMNKVDLHNQSLRAAEAQYRQALALSDSTRSSLFPTATLNGGQTRGLGANAADPHRLSQVMSSSMTISWAPDVWGKIRRTLDAQTASAQASQADLENAKLSIHTTFAQTYFQLRAVDTQKHLYDQTIRASLKNLRILQNQYHAGIVPRMDVDQAETTLNTTKALAADLNITRGVLEHALAVLIGEEPARFSVAEQPLTATLFPIPVGLPAELLERRPDIASAERRMAEANAKIGVAEAAFFPALTLNATGGYQNTSWSHLLSLPHRFWSLGPSIALTLFDGGARSALRKQALAAYDQAVASYRQTVLSAFQNVEDQLLTLRSLEEEINHQDRALAAARQMVLKAEHQYQMGTISMQGVLTAQMNLLTLERTRWSLIGRHFSAHVGLIAALGGVWSRP